MRDRADCPTPEKEAFATGLEAWRALDAWRRRQTRTKTMRRSRGQDSRLMKYECVAGHWHLGSGRDRYRSTRRARRNREGIPARSS